MSFVPRVAREGCRPAAARLVDDETAIHGLCSAAPIADRGVRTGGDDQPVPPEVAVDLDGRVLHDENAGATAFARDAEGRDRKSTRLNSSHLVISYAVFCLKKKKKKL